VPFVGSRIIALRDYRVSTRIFGSNLTSLDSERTTRQMRSAYADESYELAPSPGDV
jgi:hypothetical protein